MRQRVTEGSSQASPVCFLNSIMGNWWNATAFVGVGEESEAPTDSYRWIFPLTVVSSERLVVHITPLFSLAK